MSLTYVKYAFIVKSSAIRSNVLKFVLQIEKVCDDNGPSYSTEGRAITMLVVI